MKIQDWFSLKREKEVAEVLAALVVKSIPPDLTDKRSKVISVNKISKILEGMCADAERYQKERRPGLFRRAVIANNFRWELTTQGYRNDFINLATEALVVALGKKIQDK